MTHLLRRKSIALMMVAMLLTTVLHCMAQSRSSDNEDQTLQLLRQATSRGPDAIDATKTLISNLKSGDTSLYTLLTRPDREQAKMALAFIGNRCMGVIRGKPPRLSAASAFLAEMCQSQNEFALQHAAMYLLSGDTENAKILCGFLADDRIAGDIRFEALMYVSLRTDAQRNPDERQALEAVLPSLLSLWDKPLWDARLIRSELDAEDHRRQIHSRIAALVGSMPITPALMKNSVDLASQPEIAVALIQSLSKQKPPVVSDLDLFRLVGSSSRKPGGGNLAANALIHDLWVRHANLDIDAGLTSQDRLVRWGAAYVLANISDSQDPKEQTIALATAAVSPDFRDLADFRQLVGERICQGRHLEEMDRWVEDAVVGKGEYQTVAMNVLTSAADADLLPPANNEQSQLITQTMPQSQGWLGSAAVARVHWMDANEAHHRRADLILQYLDWRAGPITRLELKESARQSREYASPNSDFAPSILPLQHLKLTWSPAPVPTPPAAPLVDLGSTGWLFSGATLAVFAFIGIAAALFWALQP
jgi:hypothetical protein